MDSIFYPHQLVLIPKDYANNNPSRFIKMDGSIVEGKTIPEELRKSSLFTIANDNSFGAIPYYNENCKIYDVLGDNTVNPENAFSNNDKCMTTAIPGECAVVILLKNKNTKLTCTGISFSIDDDIFTKYGIYPKEFRVFGYDNNTWIPITGVIVSRNLNPEVDSPDGITMDWSCDVNKIVPCNGFKLVITKWSKLIVNLNPGIKLIRYHFKEDTNTLKTIDIECPENFVYCFDLYAHIRTNVNNNDCALENKIVNLIRKHIKFPESCAKGTDGEYVADLSNFYNTHLTKFEERLNKVEERESYGEVKLITASKNDSENVLKCEPMIFQEVVVVGSELPDKTVTINLPDDPNNGDSINIVSFRTDNGKTIIDTGMKNIGRIRPGANGVGRNITLPGYGTSAKFTFFDGVWMGIV